MLEPLQLMVMNVFFPMMS